MCDRGSCAECEFEQFARQMHDSLESKYQAKRAAAEKAEDPAERKRRLKLADEWYYARAPHGTLTAEQQAEMMAIRRERGRAERAGESMIRGPVEADGSQARMSARAYDAMRHRMRRVSR